MIDRRSVRCQDPFQCLAEESFQRRVHPDYAAGVPVAKLVPDDEGERVNLKEVVRDIRAARKGVTLGKISIRELINEGRRY